MIRSSRRNTREIWTKRWSSEHRSGDELMMRGREREREREGGHYHC